MLNRRLRKKLNCAHGADEETGARATVFGVTAKHLFAAVFMGERDGCSWLECPDCGARGPKKHSRVLAWRRFAAVGFVA